MYCSLGVSRKHEDWILCYSICHVSLVRHGVNVFTAFNTSNSNAFSRALVGELFVVVLCLIIPRFMNILPCRQVITLSLYLYLIWLLLIVPGSLLCCTLCAVTALLFLTCNALRFRWNLCDTCVIQMEMFRNVDNELNFEEVVSCTNNARAVGSKSVVC